MNKSATIWMNGKLVPWDEAKVHILSHALHYGSSVFEGMRAYSTPRGPAVFRLRDHVRRLFDSAKIYKMEIRFSEEEIAEAIRETIRANALDACYVRPLVYRGFGEVGVSPYGSPVDVAIATWVWGAYLGKDAAGAGVDVQVSSWGRFSPNTLPALAKAAANYMNSQLVKMEALDNGFAEGIILNATGNVCEGSGENVFVVWSGKIRTPPIASSILHGITRDSVMRIARDLGHEVVEEEVPRELLYIADEVFLTGSAAEITPVRSVDRRPVGGGLRGPVTAGLQKAFSEITSGCGEDRYGWLDRV
jgi:branched-chain amino acid aminotransferase